MNIFQHFGGKIPTYKEFLNSKRIRYACEKYTHLHRGYGDTPWRRSVFTMNNRFYCVAISFAVSYPYRHYVINYDKTFQKAHRNLFFAVGGI